MTHLYASFDRILLDRPAPGVLRLTLNAPDKLNALDVEAHRQMETVWEAIDRDPDTRCSIITGAGKAFCAGGDASSFPSANDGDALDRFSMLFNGASRLVYALINSRKPIVSAINGAAVGAGLAIALLADVPIAARSARLLDGHTKLGVAAGDHAAIIWPLLCGMAKSKYYLMTSASMTGEEAERNNLVAMVVDDAQLQAKALAVATQLAGGAASAIRMTKYVLNHWLRQQASIFDLSLAMELVNMEGRELREGVKALGERRPPNFPMDSRF